MGWVVASADLFELSILPRPCGCTRTLVLPGNHTPDAGRVGVLVDAPVRLERLSESVGKCVSESAVDILAGFMVCVGVLLHGVFELAGLVETLTC